MDKEAQLKEGWEIPMCQGPYLVSYALCLDFWKIPPFYLVIHDNLHPCGYNWKSHDCAIWSSPRQRAINICHRSGHMTEDWLFSSFPRHLKLKERKDGGRKISLSPSDQTHQIKKSKSYSSSYFCHRDLKTEKAVRGWSRCIQVRNGGRGLTVSKSLGPKYLFLGTMRYPCILSRSDFQNI